MGASRFHTKAEFRDGKKRNELSLIFVAGWLGRDGGVRAGLDRVALVWTRTGAWADTPMLQLTRSANLVDIRGCILSRSSVCVVLGCWEEDSMRGRSI